MKGFFTEWWNLIMWISILEVAILPWKYQALNKMRQFKISCKMNNQHVYRRHLDVIKRPDVKRFLLRSQRARLAGQQSISSKKLEYFEYSTEHQDCQEYSKQCNAHPIQFTKIYFSLGEQCWAFYMIEITAQHCEVSV